MTEGGTSQEQQEAGLASIIYAQADSVLQNVRPFYTSEGGTKQIASFFSDPKDIRGCSDLSLEKDLIDRTIKISAIRKTAEDLALIRELTLSESGITGLVVKRRDHHEGHYILKFLYDGKFDRSKISLDSVYDWVFEAGQHIMSDETELPCSDLPSVRRIRLSPNIVKKLLKKP